MFGNLANGVRFAGLLLAAPRACSLGGFQEQAPLEAYAGLMRGGVIYFFEHARHSQQVGRAKTAQIGQQRLRIRQVADHTVIGGDGSVLDEPGETVRQRQEQQQTWMIVEDYLVQRLAGGDRDAHEVAVRELNAFWQAGGAGGVHDGRQIVYMHRGDTFGKLLVGHRHAEPFQRAQRVAVDHEDLL